MTTYLRSLQFQRFVIMAAFIAAIILVSPLMLHAQATASSAPNTTLSAVIRASILKDPRAADLSASEIDSLVAALTAQAVSQGVSAQAIAYRPGAPVPGASMVYHPGTCTDISPPLCNLGQALGYDNPDKSVPIGLWITSGLLILIIWRIRRHHPEIIAGTPPPSAPKTGPLG